LTDHHKWVQDINEYGSKFAPTDVQFPIVSCLYALKHKVSQRNYTLCRSPTLTARSPRCTTCWMLSTRRIAMLRDCLSLYVFTCGVKLLKWPAYHRNAAL
jgi:hypothetical protein